MCDSVGTPRLMLVEAFVGGCRLINLRSYSYRPMIAVNVGLPWSHVENYALDKTGSVGYSGLDFITIGARDILLRLVAYVAWQRLQCLPNRLVKCAVKR